MSITDERRREVINGLTGDFRTLYESPEAGDSMYAIFKKQIPHERTLDSYAIYATFVGDTILGFYKTNELPGLLVKEVGVTPEVAKQIMADLKDFLQPVYEREATLAGQKQEDLKALHEQLANPDTRTPGTPKTDSPTLAAAAIVDPTVTGKQIPVPMPAATADQPETAASSPLDVVPMRTMAGDMQRVHGYGAFRDQNPETDTESIVHSSQTDVLQK